MKIKTRSRQAIIRETLRQLGHPITAKVRSPLQQATQYAQIRFALSLPHLILSWRQVIAGADG